MKILFDDGSFIRFDEVLGRKDKLVTITTCGLKNNKKSLIMSSSELDCEQVNEIIDFLSKLTKKSE